MLSSMIKKLADDRERYFGRVNTPIAATPPVSMTKKLAVNLARELIPCPVCRGSGRNPEAPAELVDDDGTCLVCCFSLHPLYAAHHGHVWPIP